MLVQASLVFSMKGGYLSKALSRRKVDKTALEPLSITEILGVSAGCEGYDHNNLPSSSRKSKKGENKNGSLFITIKGTPTPLASSRLYFLKFKSRSVRNDLLLGLRGLLADLQVNEGISISTIQNPSMNSENNATDTPRRMSSNLPQDAEKILVPLPEVHKAINSERESYDRLLLLMLQGSTDLKNSEDDLVGLRGTLEAVFAESKEKDKIQARNELEAYLYNLKNSINDVLQGKLTDDESSTLNTAINDGLDWLEDHPAAEKDEYDDKQKEVETIANPILKRAYESGANSNDDGDDFMGEDGDGLGDEPPYDEMD